MSPKAIKVLAPSFEHHHSGLGINTSTPRISWSFEQLESPQGNDWGQHSYDLQIKFSSDGEYETFHVEGVKSVCVPWPARPLASREQATVRVRCHGSAPGSDPQPTEWSDESILEAALLSPTDWTARWIAAPVQAKNHDKSLKPIRLARSFELDPNVISRARLYITSQGCYHATINQRPVGNHCMAPGWQSYKHRLHYQIFDVTDLLASTNVIDVQVGAGWYASALAWAGGRRCFYGDRLAVLAQLMVDLTDGSTVTIDSDDTWRCINSPIVSSEIYNGEVFDMSLSRSSSAESTDTIPAGIITDPTKAELVSPSAPPVRVTQTISPQTIFKSKTGKTLIDFGQNLVGRLRIQSLQKPAGTIITFSHAEVLENGELGIRPLRHAKATDTIICDGSTLIDWTPKFTFHGFRYVQVTGWTPEDETCPLTTTSLIAEVMHSDMTRTGWFTCSNPLINKLHENAVWSMRGNFLSVPTDCPQRDERLGWTGDIQVFAPSANFLYNTTGMLNNWLDDLAVEQAERDGIPPFVVPDVITNSHPGETDYWPHIPNAVWDDVAVLLPWSLYQSSGDLHTLHKQYQSMKDWVDKGIKRGDDNLWDPDLYQLGDWLDPLAPPSEPGNGRTNGTLVADAYLVQVTSKLAETARLLNDQDNLERYRQQSQEILQTFRDKYITKSGLIASHTQTALSLSITFNLLPTPSQLHTAGNALARLVRTQQFRVATGFAGTPLILHALTKTGHTPLAYRMLLEQRCPSWMYAVLMGATTIWERWDSMLSDGSVNPGEMTSFNHYALGSVVGWMHGVVGGIEMVEAGWKCIRVWPRPGGGLRFAKVAHLGPYGLVECEWRVEGDVLKMVVKVPPNSRALVVDPGEEDEEVGRTSGTWVGCGRHEFEFRIVGSEWPPEAIMPPFWPQPAPLLAE